MRIRKVFSKIMAVALTVTLLIGIPPLSAYAAVLTVTTFDALLTATSAAGGAPGDTVRLGGNITDGSRQLDIGRDLTLDLNGKNLTISVMYGNAIKIARGVTLTITDSAPGPTNKLSVVNTFNLDVGDGAGINTSDGALIIRSGRVEAKGGIGGAGIGGGISGDGGNITITGGNVTAIGGGGYIQLQHSSGGAGIGGGRSGNNLEGGNGGNITITGGTVTATAGYGGASSIGGGPDGGGGNITISGGTVTAYPNGEFDGGTASGAGIGGASSEGDAGTITINGTAKVTAYGSKQSAGIGGSMSTRNDLIGSRIGDGGTITIGGSAEVIAIGGNAGAGIGGASGGLVSLVEGESRGSNGGRITINGNARVTATGGSSSAGIGGGGGAGPGGTLSIGGAARITATGGQLAAGIGGGFAGDGGDIMISGGTISVVGGSFGGPGIGGGASASAGNVTISGGNITATGGSLGGAGIGGGYTGVGGNILITGENTEITATGALNSQDIGGGEGGRSVNAFVALPRGRLKNSSGNIGNNVLFTANPASTGTVTAALPAPFHTAGTQGNGLVSLLTGLNPTGKTMSFLTSLSAVGVTFALPGYAAVNKEGAALMASGASVAFAVPTGPSLTLSVSPAGSLTLPGSVTLTATLSGAYPNNAGKTVIFTVNGAAYTAATNSSGIANYTFSGIAAGTYSFGLSFAGDANNGAAVAAGISGYVVRPGSQAVRVSGRLSTYNPGRVTTIRLMRGDVTAYETATAAWSGTGRTEQAFAIEGVAPGTYTLIVSKAAHTDYIVRNLVVGASALDLTQDVREAVRLMALRCGDINGDGTINSTDLNLLWSSGNYMKAAATAENPLADLDGDGAINSSDLSILWSSTNYMKDAVIVD
jgi:hypothetical protein